MGSTQFTSAAFWGDVDTTPQDLSNLINYVLDKTPPKVRNYLVYRLQHVSAIDQQWGVWARARTTTRATRTAGSRTRTATACGSPTRSGSPARTSSTPWPSCTTWAATGRPGDSGFNYGTNKLTQISAMLFQGHHTEHPTPQASAVP